MSRRRLVLFSMTFLLSAGVAYALRDAIYQLVIVPLAYFWWVLGIYYRLIPQVFLWIMLIIVVLYSAVKGLLQKSPVNMETRGHKILHAGPIELLAGHIEKRRHGNYYKWLVANRLGKLARELLNQREGLRSPRRFTRLASRDWNPPEGVREYLEVGLNGSFADYPRSLWSRPKWTPLDVPPKLVIEYLEGEMENNWHGYR